MDNSTTSRQLQLQGDWLQGLKHSFWKNTILAKNVKF